MLMLFHLEIMREKEGGSRLLLGNIPGVLLAPSCVYSVH